MTIWQAMNKLIAIVEPRKANEAKSHVFAIAEAVLGQAARSRIVFDRLFPNKQIGVRAKTYRLELPESCSEAEIEAFLKHVNSKPEVIQVSRPSRREISA